MASLLNVQINNKLVNLQIRNFDFDWSRPYIMGILNVTPDSFSDGGEYFHLEKAVSHCLKMIEDGAEIIDVGGESTRPNAQIVSVEEEINRVIPVIKSIREKNSEIVISIDTRNYLTAKSAIEAGADIINDVSGLDYDDKLLEYVVQNNLPVVIMHSDKVPAVSSDFTDLDIVEEVYFSLNEKINKLVNLGLDRKNIIIDIGIGFGKSIESNFELLKRLDEFTTLGCPVVLGISRKSFMTDNNSDIQTSLYSAMLPSVNIHRVHNVAMVRQYLSYASLLHD